jgi:carbamoylphosphate synthase small subunit
VSTRDAYLFDPDDTLSATWGIADGPLPEADIPVVAIDYGLKRNICAVCARKACG